MGHRYSPSVFEDLNFERRDYEPWAAYAQSKIANILFALELDKRGKNEDVRAFSLHPGNIVNTGLVKHISQEELIARGSLDTDGNPILDPARQLKTIPQGAATAVWCATSPKLEGMGGVYCENCDIAPIIKDDNKEPTQLRGVMPYAIDPEQANRLWNMSEKLIGLEAWLTE